MMQKVGRFLKRHWKPLAGVTSSHLYYNILVDNARQLSRDLYRRGIDAPTSEFTDCSKWEPGGSTCPRAGEIEARILRLPNSSVLGPGAVQRIIRAVGRCAGQG